MRERIMIDEKILEELSDAFYRKTHSSHKKDQNKKHGHKHHQDKHGMHFVLGYLFDNQDQEIFPMDLSEAMNVSAPRITAILKECEKKELIQKIHSQEDKRMVTVSLTEKGKEQILHQREKWDRQIRLLMDRIGPEDSQALVRILEAYSQLKEEGLWK
ncbi:MAG: MarR family winged helix-turn-helix transcriptional regulator [Floccifex sp.]